MPKPSPLSIARCRACTPRGCHGCSSLPGLRALRHRLSASCAKPENVVLLARLGSEPAGYVYAEIARWPETSLCYAHAMIYLHHISVAAPCRQRGVGRALVEAVRRIGAQHGISTLALDVWSFNEPARRFFRRCGLAPYNERLWIE